MPAGNISCREQRGSIPYARLVYRYPDKLACLCEDLLLPVISRVGHMFNSFHDRRGEIADLTAL